MPQEKPSKHHKAIESSVQSAQHVPLQPECYSIAAVTSIIANIFENSIWKIAQAVVAEINSIEFPKGLKRPLFNRLQAILAQANFLKTAQISKKTFWKCSQFVALQVKFVQTAEILKDSRWKGFQLIPCHVEGPEAFQTLKNVFIKSHQTGVG